MREGDEDSLSENGKAKTSSQAGLRAKVICRGESENYNCAYKVKRVNCGGGKTTDYVPGETNSDGSVDASAQSVKCGKSVKLYDGAATAVTVLMSSLDGSGSTLGPAGTAGKSALFTTLSKSLYTFQNPTTLYGYCLGEGDKGCEFTVVAAEHKTP